MSKGLIDEGIYMHILSKHVTMGFDGQWIY